MGSVWRARHRLLARDAAIKLVKAETMGDTASIGGPTCMPSAVSRSIC